MEQKELGWGGREAGEGSTVGWLGAGVWSWRLQTRIEVSTLARLSKISNTI